MMKELLDLLKELTAPVGVSGAEEGIVSLLREKLAPYGEVSVDAMQNVTCTFGAGYHFLLDAHMDEIGLVVTEITDDGFLKFAKCGGVDARLLPGYPVSVWGKQELTGVITTLPPHLTTAEDEKKVPELKALSIDTGFSATALRTLVAPGDRVTLRRNFTPLLNNTVSASCLDDRSGVAAILLALDRLKTLPCKITVLFSTQEELGTRGAKIGPFAKKVDEALVVDVSFAYTPGCDRADCGELGKGAMIGFSPILDKEMSKRLAALAEEQQIPHQAEVMGGRTGTNADVLSISEQGIKTALLSIPEKYMHQPVEVVSLADIQSVSDLLCAYITEKAGGSHA